MPPSGLHTLGDLAGKFNLHAVCVDCNRQPALDLAGLIERYGADCTIANIKAMVRCDQCRRRTGKILLVYCPPEPTK